MKKMNMKQYILIIAMFCVSLLHAQTAGRSKYGKITNLGKNVNSSYEDYQPTITADEKMILFASYRPGGLGAEDFWIAEKIDSVKWGMAYNVGAPVNTPGTEGSGCISADGQKIYYVKNLDDGNNCDIFVSTLKGKQWSPPERLPPTVNSPYWDSQPSISADGTMLFFASNRPGGKGLTDIWWSRKGPDGKWQQAKPITKINTPESEATPYIHADNKTLFFSTNGRPGLGGYDVFRSIYDAEKDEWSTPVNMGDPICSELDDKYFILSPDGNRGYFASNRDGGFGEHDLYMINMFAGSKQVIVTLTGFVKDAKTLKPVGAKVTLMNLTKGEKINEFDANSDNGKYLVVMQGGNNYGLFVEADGYAPFSESYYIDQYAGSGTYPRDILLKSLVGETTTLNNIFFETGKAVLLPSSKIELDKMVEIMKKNPSLKAEIIGHTDNQGTPEGNQKLSEERAKAVAKYLSDNGVGADRLKTKGYGDTKPVADNTTEEGRRKNRRVEMAFTK